MPRGGSLSNALALCFILEVLHPCCGFRGGEAFFRGISLRQVHRSSSLSYKREELRVYRKRTAHVLQCASLSEPAQDKTDSASSPENIQTVVICGPSGVGKGTIINKLKEELAGRIGFCVSHTTRQPRAGEMDGREYWFTDQAEMRQRVERGEFLEVNEVHGELYGTSRAALLAVVSSGLLPVLDVDVKGARDLRRSGISGLYLFIAPPSLDQLEMRLRLRRTETETSLNRRVAAASSEIEASKEEGLFDEIVINDVLDDAFEIVKSKISPFLKNDRREKVILPCGDEDE
eukprot:65466-Hanusia_phi.AAC.2